MMDVDNDDLDSHVTFGTEATDFDTEDEPEPPEYKYNPKAVKKEPVEPEDDDEGGENDLFVPDPRLGGMLKVVMDGRRSSDEWSGAEEAKSKSKKKNIKKKEKTKKSKRKPTPSPTLPPPQSKPKKPPVKRKPASPAKPEPKSEGRGGGRRKRASEMTEKELQIQREKWKEEARARRAAKKEEVVGDPEGETVTRKSTGGKNEGGGGGGGGRRKLVSEMTEEELKIQREKWREETRARRAAKRADKEDNDKDSNSNYEAEKVTKSSSRSRSSGGGGGRRRKLASEMTPEELEANREKWREEARRRRAVEAPEAIEARREKWREEQRLKRERRRETMTVTDLSVQKEKERLRQATKRQNATAEQIEEMRQKSRDYAKRLRETLTPEQKRENMQKAALARIQRRSMMTEEEREEELKRKRFKKLERDLLLLTPDKFQEKCEAEAKRDAKSERKRIWWERHRFKQSLTPQEKAESRQESRRQSLLRQRLKKRIQIQKMIDEGAPTEEIQNFIESPKLRENRLLRHRIYRATTALRKIYIQDGLPTEEINERIKYHKKEFKANPQFLDQYGVSANYKRRGRHKFKWRPVEQEEMVLYNSLQQQSQTPMSMPMIKKDITAVPTTSSSSFYHPHPMEPERPYSQSSAASSINVNSPEEILPFQHSIFSTTPSIPVAPPPPKRKIKAPAPETSAQTLTHFSAPSTSYQQHHQHHYQQQPHQQHQQLQNYPYWNPTPADNYSSPSHSPEHYYDDSQSDVSTPCPEPEPTTYGYSNGAPPQQFSHHHQQPSNFHYAAATQISTTPPKKKGGRGSRKFSGDPQILNVDCEFCGKSIRKKNMELHKRFSHNPNFVNNQCTLCGQHFKKPLTFWRHYRTEHLKLATKQRLHNAGKPPKSRQWQLERKLAHKLNPRPRKNKQATPPNPNHPYMCTQCGSSFRYPAQLKTHTHYVHELQDEQDFKFQCSVCGKRLKRAHQVDRHMLKKHQIQTKEVQARIKCKICMKLPPDSPLYQQHHQETFETEIKLKRHFKEKHPEATHKCLYCPVILLSKLGWKFHITRCKAGNSEEQMKMRHEWKEKGEDQSLDRVHIKCEFCPNEIGSMQLDNHYMKVHKLKELVEGWTCKECFQSFKKREYYLVHLEQIHDWDVAEAIEHVRPCNIVRKEGEKLEVFNVEGARITKASKGHTKLERRKKDVKDKGKGKKKEGRRSKKKNLDEEDKEEKSKSGNDTAEGEDVEHKEVPRRSTRTRAPYTRKKAEDLSEKEREKWLKKKESDRMYREKKKAGQEAKDPEGSDEQEKEDEEEMSMSEDKTAGKEEEKKDKEVTKRSAGAPHARKKAAEDLSEKELQKKQKKKERDRIYREKKRAKAKQEAKSAKDLEGPEEEEEEEDGEDLSLPLDIKPDISMLQLAEEFRPELLLDENTGEGNIEEKNNQKGKNCDDSDSTSDSSFSFEDSDSSD